MYKKILKEVFGFDSFRPIQKEAIKAISDKEDILVILPTGSGKSLIYQLPSLLIPGTTIVISPLIALMQDQVASLKINGIKAEMLNSGNSTDENSQIIKKLLSNELKLLYVAPERFNPGFIDILKSAHINFFVVDEAHCVSEWGHEFRNDYRRLSNLKEWFDDIPIAAFSATATKEAQKDIVKTLKLKRVLRAPTKRENLFIRSQRRAGDGKNQIVSFLKAHKDECGIVYAFTRKETERLSNYLNSLGFETLPYHAGLETKKRDEVFNSFKNEDIKIIVATIAFGMGIDKSNIRFVLHTSMPKTLENYYQEIGRAGRDSLKSEALLLYSKADEISKRVFIDELPESEYKQNLYKKINTMYRFAVTSKCRHRFIAKYFGDEISECKTNCDNCVDTDKELIDITLPAQKFLSAIYRTGERFGQGYIVDILRGSKSKRIVDLSHDKLSVYGIGKEYSKAQWGIIYDKLLDIEAIYQDSEFASLKLTTTGKEILKKLKTVEIDKRDLEIKKSSKEKNQTQQKDENFEKLRELRTLIAKEEQVPAYIIFSDKALLEISQKLPQNRTEFLDISGVGEVKLEKYAERFLSLCKELKNSHPKPLSKTYMESLELINEGKSFDEICKIREYSKVTILIHLKKLTESGFISQEKKEELTKELKESFPKEIKRWIEKGLQIDEIKNLSQWLQIYKMII